MIPGDKEIENIRAMIDDLPEDEKQQAIFAAGIIRTISRYLGRAGRLAVALVSAEILKEVSKNRLH